MDSGKRDLKCVVKASLEMNCTVVVLTRFQEDPMLVHIQLRPEVWSFILLDRNDASNESAAECAFTSSMYADKVPDSC